MRGLRDVLNLGKLGGWWFIMRGEGVSDGRSLVVEELLDGSTNHCYLFYISQRDIINRRG